MQHTTVETLLIHVPFGGSETETFKQKNNLPSYLLNAATALVMDKVSSGPGTGELLEFDEEHLCELFCRVFVQGPVLLHSSVQGAELD